MPKQTRKQSKAEARPYVRTAVNPSTMSGSKSPVAAKLVAELEKVFKKATNKREALAMKKYMRGQFEFFGIKTPQRRELGNQVLAQFPMLSSSDVRSTVALTWDREQREFHYFGIDMLIKQKKLLSKDIETCIASWSLVQSLLTRRSWWDTVDMLASNMIGHFAQEYPDNFKPILDQWVQSENMWIRRTAIIHQLKYRTHTDKDALFRYCLRCCGENEFFIQKAIGWALREYHKTNPEDVKDFVEEHNSSLAKLSIREALKHAK